MSFQNARKPAAMRWWLFAGCGVLGLGTIALTAVLMGQWPTRADPATQIAAQSDVEPRISRPVTNRHGLTAASSTASASSAHVGIDVLSRLETAGRDATLIRPESNLSNTLDEALQRALSFPDFGALAGRTDPEGLFEAAAWVDACERGAFAAQDLSLRCREPGRHGAQYTDDLLKQAADAGQPGAVLTLAARHPEQWVEIPLNGGGMLGDRVFALAALGRSAALVLLSQLCAVPDVCVDEQLTRNVLALLQLSIYKTGTSEAGDYLTGSENNRREAVERAARLRTALQWPP
ncbi:hypothetical protein [Paraburkholderia sp. BL21I4N1]|uniref:hypothetical protein n=1 Tax=Paraburkholderia sp. BL21I4N1 TaxID=1938801 RepID=UPI000D44AEE7|nr:hypothetical protein [Paraburkholderia sp. BL21I4N1]PQV49198.1 hypothetical protein B0G83_107143 [Paraburkholderia sp. BL21I4N1]